MPSIQHLLILLVVVLLIFGTKKLRNIGEDLGGAIKGFKQGMKDGSEDKPAEPAVKIASGETVEGQAREKKD